MFRGENLDKITKILDHAEKLEKNGSFFEAIEKYEKAKLLLSKKTFNNKEGYKNLKNKICELSNMLAIMFLQQNNKKGCFELLKKAEKNAQGSIKNLSLTFNNYACFYKSIGKYRVALSFLQEALLLEKKKKNSQSVADIFLNICAVLSKLKRHKEAFHASLNSIVLIQEDLLSYCIPFLLNSFKDQDNNKENLAKTKKHKNVKNGKNLSRNIEEKEEELLQPKLKFSKGSKAETKVKIEEESNAKLDKDKLYQRIIILSIAYHNLAVELEHLRLYEDSLSTYQKAYNFSKNILGQKTEMVENLKQVLSKAKKQLKEKLTKKKDNIKKEKKYFLKRKEICSSINKNQENEFKKNKIYSAQPIRDMDFNKKSKKEKKKGISKESIIFDDEEDDISGKSVYDKPKMLQKNQINNLEEFYNKKIKNSDNEVLLNENSELNTKIKKKNNKSIFKNSKESLNKLDSIRIKNNNSNEKILPDGKNNFNINNKCSFNEYKKKMNNKDFSKINVEKEKNISINMFENGNNYIQNTNNKISSKHMLDENNDQKNYFSKQLHENDNSLINISNKIYSKKFIEIEKNFFEKNRTLINLENRETIIRNADENCVDEEEEESISDEAYDNDLEEFGMIEKEEEINKKTHNKNFIDFSKFSQENSITNSDDTSLCDEEEFAIDNE